MLKIALPEEPRDVRVMNWKQENIVRKHLDCVKEEDHEMRQNALQDKQYPMHITDRDEDNDEGDY